MHDKKTENEFHRRKYCENKTLMWHKNTIFHNVS